MSKMLASDLVKYFTDYNKIEMLSLQEYLKQHEFALELLEEYDFETIISCINNLKEKGKEIYSLGYLPHVIKKFATEQKALEVAEKINNMPLGNLQEGRKITTTLPQWIKVLKGG